MTNRWNFFFVSLSCKCCISKCSCICFTSFAFTSWFYCIYSSCNCFSFNVSFICCTSSSCCTYCVVFIPRICWRLPFVWSINIRINVWVSTFTSVSSITFFKTSCFSDYRLMSMFFWINSFTTTTTYFPVIIIIIMICWCISMFFNIISITRSINNIIFISNIT